MTTAATRTLLLWLLLLVSAPTYGWRLWSKTGNGPEARRGHSLLTLKNYVVLFGGKGNDKNVFHLPKTFELVSRHGALEFASYDQQAVSRSSRERVPLVEGDPFFDVCLDLIATDPEQAKNRTECKFGGNKTEHHSKENYIPVSTYFNDIWWYNMECKRYGDGPCTDKAWEVVDPGARLGGCKLVKGVDVCTHPNERFGHAAHIINDELMIVFGGFSHFCGDFCDDAWVFFFPQNGLASNTAEPGQRWVPLEIIDSPGGRWKMASTLVGSSLIYLYGGHRLWHGFADDNSRANRYESTEELPKGGYMDDLWKLDMSSCLLAPDGLNLEEQRAHYNASCKVNWESISPKRNCSSLSLLENKQLKPGYTWEQRHEKLCFTVWPPARSAGALVHFDGNLYLFGGYRTFFPYPNTRAAGSGIGTSFSEAAGKFRPYPTYNYYLGDFWRYDLTNGYWHVMETVDGIMPAARTEFSFVATSDMLVLHGGYRSNYYMNELWYYNVSSSRWRRKEEFVHPNYPVNCTLGGVVQAWPTRGTVVDGKFGRASEHFPVNLTRKLAPNWDGCRDRADERRDMPWKLQWQEPTQRSHHAMTYFPQYETLMLFGGHGDLQEELEQVALTKPVTAAGDLWQYRIHQCINNCSNNGLCSYGTCRCDSGYYGIDCSNVSCPGDFCYYDEVSQEQICEHCCHAPYVHTDDDVYIADYGKLPCSPENPGRSNGICDGSGKCLCQPPFIGLDCAIKDCPNKCSGNGWCSEEYPVSRCMCEPGFTGFDCSVKECLNNCSYPNGHCVNGDCKCSMILDPYNRSRNWRRYEGLDCSFLIPYASGVRIELQSFLLVSFSLLFCYFLPAP